MSSAYILARILSAVNRPSLHEGTMMSDDDWLALEVELHLFYLLYDWAYGSE